jgi:hypothetical protein
MLKNFRLTLFAWIGYFFAVLSGPDALGLAGLILFGVCIVLVLTYRCRSCGRLWLNDLSLPRDSWKFLVFLHRCRSPDSRVRS